MNDKEFINEIKKAVIGATNHMRVVRKLKELGFEEVKAKNGFHSFTHKRLGNYKVSIGVSSSCDARWGLNFVRDIRHAMWKVAA